VGGRGFAERRVADVLGIEGSALPPEPYRFALQAHLDVAVRDGDLGPSFAAGDDGPSHADWGPRRRDATNGTVCDRLEVPLLRIRQTYIDVQTTRIDLVARCVHAWFSTRAVVE
jgi:hypothetical protein